MQVNSFKRDDNSLNQVLNQGQVWQARQQPQSDQAVISSGYAELDARLPGGGWQAGQVCEIYHQGPGTGELSLVLPALAQLSEQPRWILWVAPPAIPYAPALTLAGVNLKHVLVVHPKHYREAIWCMEEGLRSGHCSAVLGWLHEWHKPHIRRLQLAAADAGIHCWLWPRTEFDTSGSPAPLRLGVERPDPATLRVQCFKRRGSWPSAAFDLNLDNYAPGAGSPAGATGAGSQAIELATTQQPPAND